MHWWWSEPMRETVRTARAQPSPIPRQQLARELWRWFPPARRVRRAEAREAQDASQIGADSWRRERVIAAGAAARACRVEVEVGVHSRPASTGMDEQLRVTGDAIGVGLGSTEAGCAQWMGPRLRRQADGQARRSAPATMAAPDAVSSGQLSPGGWSLVTTSTRKPHLPFAPMVAEAVVAAGVARVVETLGRRGPGECGSVRAATPTGSAHWTWQVAAPRGSLPGAPPGEGPWEMPSDLTGQVVAQAARDGLTVERALRLAIEQWLAQQVGGCDAPETLPQQVGEEEDAVCALSAEDQVRAAQRHRQRRQQSWGEIDALLHTVRAPTTRSS